MRLLNLIFLMALLQGCGSKLALSLPKTQLPPPAPVQPAPVQPAPTQPNSDQ